MHKDSLEKIWGLAKHRFLCDEFSFGEKTHRPALLYSGIAIFICFEFFSPPPYDAIKYIGFGLLFAFFYQVMGTIVMLQSYRNGYERGFIDAATKNMHIQSLDETQEIEAQVISETLDEILANTENLAHGEKYFLYEGNEKHFLSLFKYIKSWGD